MEMGIKAANIIYTPQAVSRYTLDVIQKRQEASRVGLQTNVPALDDALTPLLPGELVVVLARPGHFKTQFMQFWARQVVEQIASMNTREIVVFCTWEMAVEELGYYDLAAAAGVDSRSVWYGKLTSDCEARVREAARRRERMPIWLIGHSYTRKGAAQRVTVQDVREALLTIERVYGAEPAIVFMDYLQQIDVPEGRDRREEVMYLVDDCKQLARDAGCPVVVACQAGRQVDGRQWKLPDVGDAQETSRVEQAADKLLSLWLPFKTEPVGSILPHLNIAVSEDLLIVGVRKQRMGPSGRVIVLSVDPAHNVVRTMRVTDAYGES